MEIKRKTVLELCRFLRSGGDCDIRSCAVCVQDPSQSRGEHVDQPFAKRTPGGLRGPGSWCQREEEVKCSLEAHKLTEDVTAMAEAGEHGLTALLSEGSCWQLVHPWVPGDEGNPQGTDVVRNMGVCDERGGDVNIS